MPSPADSEEDARLDPTGDSPEASAIPLASGLGKRRRRNPGQEAERQAKRRKKNPRKRQGSKRERIDKGKAKKAREQAVQSDKHYESLNRSKGSGIPRQVFNLDTLTGKAKKPLEVIHWDGV